jgi:hypothetical protein
MHTHWITRAIVVLTALTAIAIISTQALAASACKQISGKLTLQPVADGCLSAVGVCAIGTYSGGLAGRSTFIGSSLIQTADTPGTSVVLLTGDNTIETKHGVLFTKDAIVLATSGAREFAEVDTIVGGTGDLAGAAGRITATGTFTAAAGGAGSYSGEICTP